METLQSRVHIRRHVVILVSHVWQVLLVLGELGKLGVQRES